MPASSNHSSSHYSRAAVTWTWGSATDGPSMSILATASHNNYTQWARGTLFNHKCGQCITTPSWWWDPNSRLSSILPSSVSLFLCKCLLGFPEKGSLRGNERTAARFDSLASQAPHGQHEAARQTVHTLCVQHCPNRHDVHNGLFLFWYCIQASSTVQNTSHSS